MQLFSPDEGIPFSPKAVEKKNEWVNKSHDLLVEQENPFVL